MLVDAVVVVRDLTRLEVGGGLTTKLLLVKTTKNVIGKTTKMLLVNIWLNVIYKPRSDSR